MGSSDPLRVNRCTALLTRSLIKREADRGKGWCLRKKRVEPVTSEPRRESNGMMKQAELSRCIFIEFSAREVRVKRLFQRIILSERFFGCQCDHPRSKFGHSFLDTLLPLLGAGTAPIFHGKH